MSHNHEVNTKNDKGIKFGLVLNSIYTVIEFVFGFITGSLALIADASHNLTDTLTLTISFIANKISRRKANETKTFGYGRATILAALLNSLIMLAVAGFIIFEAIQRFLHPEPIAGGVVAIVAFVGILVNGSIALILSKQRSDLNMKSAFIDMAFDALSSLGAVIAGLIMLFTGVMWIDSIIALLIAGLLIFNTIKIIIEAVQILLEGTPKDVNLKELKKIILSTDKVLDVDDIHIWAIRSNYNALSCHIVIKEADLPKSRKIVEDIKKRLIAMSNIHHATIEVELEECREYDVHEKH